MRINIIILNLLSLSCLAQIQVSNHQGDEWHSLWTNNDSCIMYSVKENGVSNINIKNIYTGELEHIALNNIGDCYFSKCCDENPIIFYDGLENNNSPYVIYSYNLQTELNEIFISIPYVGCVHPNASYQTNLLVFNKAFNGINLYNLSTETTELLIENTYELMHPSFAPDGNRFVYTSNKSGNYDIWIYNIEEGSQENLTINPAWDDRASWSSDGRYIVFNSDRNGSDDIWLYDCYTDQFEQITFDSHTEISPSISKDGSKIAYSSDISGNFDIYFVSNPLVGIADSKSMEKAFNIYVTNDRNIVVESNNINQLKVQISLTDLSGKTLFSEHYHIRKNENLSIKPPHLAPSTYLISIESIKFEQTEKIIIH